MFVTLDALGKTVGMCGGRPTGDGLVWIEVPDDDPRCVLLPDYRELRARAYPPIQDQLDMLWHAIDTVTLDKTCEFYLTRKAVKDANPK